MSNRKLIRRVLFAAALTASTSNAANAIAYQQDLPGEPVKRVPQGNNSVTHELNRMFQESGQPMPSIIAQDLPNANVPVQGQVRPRQLQNQMATPPQSPTVNPSPNQALVRKSETASKPGVFGRLFGKLRGDTAANNSVYRPPVPPDFQPAATVAAANGSGQYQTPRPSRAAIQPSQLAQNPNPKQVQQQPSPNSAQSMAAQSHYGNRQPTGDAAGSSLFRNGASSEIPPRSGATVQTVNTPHNAASNPRMTGVRTGFTQPGSAPTFMSTVGSAAVIQKQPAAVPSPENTVRENLPEQDSSIIHDQTRLPTTLQTEMQSTSAAQDASDKFDSPFLDAPDSNTESDILDLDALIDIPAGTAVTEPTDSLDPQQPIIAGFPEANEEEVPQESSVRPDENPFTGVQLEIKDAEFFGVEEPVTDSSVEGIPLTPMEDFQSDLPAIQIPSNDLPAVELPAVDVKKPAASPEPNLQTDAAAIPAVDLTLPAENDTSARAELNATPDVPAAMSEAETEQLRQMAEQERQQRQRRLIQARAGQSGFKGFCPIQLRERRELVEANDQFTSTFGLQTYSFSSAEAKAAFDAEPSRYAPAAGGSDVVVLVNSGEEQPGLLDYAVWYRDRLYMFRSRETMTLFSKDPQRFASQY